MKASLFSKTPHADDLVNKIHAAKDNESRNIDTAAARDPACAGALCACCNKILIGNDMPPLAPTSSEDP